VTVFELSNASAACPATYSRKAPPTEEIIAMMKEAGITFRRFSLSLSLSLSARSTLVHFCVSNNNSRFCTTAQYTILKIIRMHSTGFWEVIPQIVMHGTGFKEGIPQIIMPSVPTLQKC
jgi:hypothetical protein